ncbi:hypothetical protein [Spongiimicrobium salis]|uniref:hypothetical protein n=1 Tax=Spongiimicrobium salis TaxID=1667022 RepID=UPI00374D9442
MCCISIGFQDFKERAVYWFLFPILGIFLGFLHYKHVLQVLFFSHILVNLVLITAILLILLVYSKFIVKKKFLNHSFGLGDVLLFYAFALGFPSVTFIVLFSCSILFSAIVFFALRKSLHLKTVPLAGLMALFLVFIFSYSLIRHTPSLYLL